VSRRVEGLLIPTTFVVVAVTALVVLGNWQRERLAWKQGLIATLEARLAAAPVPLPPSRVWTSLTAADEYLRVTATVTFLHDREALVYTPGSSLRRDVSGPGYWVFTPARFADGGVAMVNRGFVPGPRRDAGTRSEGQTEGSVAITGALRWPDPTGAFTPAADAAKNVWFSRDPVAIAAAKGMAAVAPFYIEQESPVPAGGLPMPGRLFPILPNNHFGYMLTWYGLAAALAAVYGAWLLAWRRRGGQAGAMAP
jgi:surfeit locus 1 family protein